MYLKDITFFIYQLHNRIWFMILSDFYGTYILETYA